jgi:hypothetical protein
MIARVWERASPKLALGVGSSVQSSWSKPLTTGFRASTAQPRSLDQATGDAVLPTSVRAPATNNTLGFMG